MTPDKQHLIDIPNLFDMMVSGGAGVATGALHDAYVGRKITVKTLMTKGALSAVVFVGLKYTMEAMHVMPEQQTAIAYFCGVLGPDIVVAFFKRKKQMIDRGLDVLEEKIKS